MSDYMNDKQLETLKQLGDLGCYTAMDTRLCKLAYDEIMRLRKQVEEMTGRNISNQLAVKLLREKVTSRDAEIQTIRNSPTLDAIRQIIQSKLAAENDKLRKRVTLLRNAIEYSGVAKTCQELADALTATEPAP